MIKRKIRYNAFKNDRELESFQDLFYEGESFEENVISYVDNRKKLNSLSPRKTSERPANLRVLEDTFSQNVIDLIDKTIGSVRHFTIKTSQGAEVIQPVKDTNSSLSKLLSSKKTFNEGSILGPSNLINNNSLDSDLATPLSKL